MSRAGVSKRPRHAPLGVGSGSVFARLSGLRGRHQGKLELSQGFPGSPGDFPGSGCPQTRMNAAFPDSPLSPAPFIGFQRAGVKRPPDLATGPPRDPPTGNIQPLSARQWAGS